MLTGFTLFIFLYITIHFLLCKYTFFISCIMYGFIKLFLYIIHNFAVS